MSIVVTLTPDELATIRCRLLPFASTSDEQLHLLRVALRGGRVQWTATDSMHAARMEVGGAVPDPDDSQFVIPARVIFLAWQMSDRRDAEYVTITIEGTNGIVDVLGVRMEFDAKATLAACIDPLFEAIDLMSSTEVVMSSEDLLALVHGATFRPPILDDDEQCDLRITVDAQAGTVHARAMWDGCADTVAWAPCRANASVELLAPPAKLNTLVGAAHQSELAIHIGGVGPMMWLRGSDGFAGWVRLHAVGIEAFRPTFEGMLAVVFEVDTDELVNVHGRYVIETESDSLFFDLLPGDDTIGTPDRIRVIATLARILDASAPLLAELNDINATIGGARVPLINDAVLVMCERAVDETDVETVATTAAMVLRHAEQLGPLFALVHG